MPEPDLFLKGFNLNVGTKLGDFTVKNSSASEKKLSRGHYSYNVTVEFSFSKNITDLNNLKQQIYSLTQEERVINSRYGNPYACSIKLIESPVVRYQTDENTITYRFTGGSDRI